MVGCGKCAVRSPDFAGGILKSFEGLWRGDFVDQMAVCQMSGGCCTAVQVRLANVEKDGAVRLLVDDVVLEDLVVQGSRFSIC